ncbi:hypothetical protein [Nonomuraea insulae]|uniref:HTH arsR-type domain-containing protein n=1 Tax=Nonomuraea insulae TaxID=1616787 RepID=A0ABW1D852_9ACTN
MGRWLAQQIETGDPDMFRSTDLLESVGGEQTGGQLYHHLRALHSARLIAQRRRGEYELAPQVMIQVLAILAAAFDPPLDPPFDPPNPE